MISKITCNINCPMQQKNNNGQTVRASTAFVYPINYKFYRIFNKSTD